jgi:prophage regulatory protein
MKPRLETTATEQWFRMRQLPALLGLSRSHIYVMLKNGLFPQPIKASMRARVWSASQLCAWQKSRIDASATETKG